jgi:putative ABC transport system permease protein
MFWRVLRESFLRTRGRQALAVLAIACGAAVATSMLAVFLTVGDRVSRELRSFGANIVVTPAADTLPVEIGGIDYRPVAEGAYISEDLLPKLKMIFWRNNIMAFAPLLYVPATLPDGSRTVLVGTWFDHTFSLSSGERYTMGIKDTNPTWKVEGKWPEEKLSAVSSQPSAIVGRRVAERLNIHPGSVLQAAGRELQITGILSTGGAEEDQVFVPLSLAQELAGQPGKLRRLQVSALTQPEDAFARRDPKTMNSADYDRWYCSAYVSSIAFQIQEALPGAVARQIRQVAQNESEVLRRIQLLMLLVTVAALAAAALAVSSATASMVIERRGELALMKALGSAGPLVAAFLLVETAIQGLVGGALGYGAGFFLAGVVGRQVFGSPAVPPPVLLPLVLTVSVAVSWLGALGPLRAALHFSPALVLKEERP